MSGANEGHTRPPPPNLILSQKFSGATAGGELSGGSIIK